MTVTSILAGYYEPGEHGRRKPESLYRSVKMWAHLQREGIPVAKSTVERLMRRWRDSGEALGGRYFACSDGLIVRDAGVEAILDVLEHLVAEGDHSSVFQPVPDEDA